MSKGSHGLSQVVSTLSQRVRKEVASGFLLSTRSILSALLASQHFRSRAQ